MKLTSMAEYVALAREKGTSLWEAALADQMADSGQSREQVLAGMAAVLEAMEAALKGYDADARSESGLTGGAGGLLREAAGAGKTLSGPFLSAVIGRALMMAEQNACMGRIVAAPTAGSCGVLPAVLLSAREHFSLSEQTVMGGLLTAGGVGAVIAWRATLSGAEGGCQAEVGSASAMTAAALTEMMGGSPEACAQAAAMALSNLLGLVCDPVAGLVEVPCVNRNVVGAMNAVAAAEMALAGIVYPIPADEVIDAMGRVGQALPPSLRETGEGGLAATPAGCRIRDRLRNRREHRQEEQA